MQQDHDVIDLREVAAALWKGRRWLVGGLALGLLLAVAATLLLPRQYTASSTVLLRSSSGGGASALSRMGGDLGALSQVLSGSMPSGFDTELQILTSRGIKEAVIDSLGLQARVVAPDALPTRRVFSSTRLAADVAEGKYRFERSGEEYRVSGPGGSLSARPGVPFEVPGGELTLSTEGLPESFEVKLMDLPAALKWLNDRLEVEEPGGDIAELGFRAGDPVTAAAVPNTMVELFLARRRTTDRGVNQRRYEFLLAREDSIATELRRAEAALRTQQESSGVIDPMLVGETELGRVVELQGEHETLGIEARTLRQILAQNREGSWAVRDLAAFPTFLNNPAINQLLGQLMEVETERTRLLERRTERDPEIEALTQTVGQLEGQLRSLSLAYLESVERQHAQLGAELQRYRGTLAQLPRHAEESFRLQRDVKLLSEMSVALQAQLLQARLAAMGEGGDIRPLDLAAPPLAPSSPRPLLNLAIGLLGGLFLGVVGALGSGFAGARVRDAREAELAAGVPALALDGGAPLLLGGVGAVPGVLVVPLGEGARAVPVARRIAATAGLRGRSVVLNDWEAPTAHVAAPATAGAPSTEETHLVLPERLEPAPRAEAGAYLVYRGAENGGGAADARLAAEELEGRFSLVVTALPGISHPYTASLLSEARPVVLVGRPGSLTRTELRDAVAALGRVGAGVAGVVLQSGEGDELTRA